MITEDYVSPETAKLLKERGFDEPCHALYHDGEDKIFFGLDEDSYRNSILNADCYACPTLQMAMKWLREKNIFIDIYHYNCRKAPFVWLIFAYNKLPPRAEQTYEQAAESAIRYILENWDDINKVLEKYYKNDEILPKI